MTQYNLTKSSFVESPTVSGTGDRELTVLERRSLYDDNTTSSGISLLGTDLLYLDIDLLNRVSIDELKLYIDVPGDRNAALIKVNFYYKNIESEDYTLCSKAQNSDTFYAINLPELFSPQFIRIIIDTLVSDIYELIITNDDGQVAFGSDGNATLVEVSHGTADYTILEIFNNSEVTSDQVNAYVIPGYKGNVHDYYLKLSNSADGEYKGIGDGGYVSNNDYSSKHVWNDGYYDGTHAESDSVKLNPFTCSGTDYYTTPVLSLGDPLMSSFLITEKTTISGTSITWSNTTNEDTVKIRSNNTDPLPFCRIFMTDVRSGNVIYIYEGNMDTGGAKTFETTTAAAAAGTSVQFDRNSGTYVILHGDCQLTRYEYNSVGILNVIKDSAVSTNYNISNNWGLDGHSNVWGYSSSGGYKLRVFDSNTFNETTLVDKGVDNFLVGFASNISYESCWYTDTLDKKLIQIRIDGTELIATSLNDPTYVCALFDGGCLVVDDGASSIYRYSYTGDVLKEIKYNSNWNIIDISQGIMVDHLLPIHKNFWVLTADKYVYQLTLDGEILFDEVYGAATSIHAFLGGCLVHCAGIDRTYQLNSSGQLSRVWNYDSFTSVGVTPFPVVIDYDEYLSLYECSNILPLSTDPVWGHSSEETWKEVPSDGYWLPFAKYHQLKYKFNGEVIEVPIVNGGAETGDFTGWETNQVDLIISTATPYKGSYYFDIYNYYGSTGNMRQKIDLTTVSGIDFNFLDRQGQLDREGYMFTLSWWQMGNYNYGGIRVEIKYYDEFDNYIQNTTYVENALGSNYWRPFFISRKLITGVRAVELIFYLSCTRQYQSGRRKYDEISAKITLSPKLELVNIPEPIKIPDIQPQTSKPVYVRAEFPVGAEYTTYETDLKCWWGNREE